MDYQRLKRESTLDFSDNFLIEMFMKGAMKI